MCIVDMLCMNVLLTALAFSFFSLHSVYFIAPVLVGTVPPTFTSPDVIHMISVPRPSQFLRSSAAVYYTERKPNNENRGGLGMRLPLQYLTL